MARQLNPVVMMSLLVAGFTCSVFAGTYSGGTGTPNDPYQIANVNDLLALAVEASDYGKCFILTANIDLTGLTFTQAPIAPDTDRTNYYQGKQFTGIFDGNGHTISNLTIGATEQDYIGLFGCVGEGGQIRNLGIENVNMTMPGSVFVGGLAGRNDGSLTGCYATGSVSGAAGYVGGLVGCNTGPLTSCYATGSVTGAQKVGGLVGESFGSDITSCYATSSVTGIGYGTIVLFGGLVGSNMSSITSCYATGSVSAGTYCSGISQAGGLVGYNYGSLTNCYATGSVSGLNDVGGLVGYNISPLTSCYAAGLVTGEHEVGGLVGWNYGSLTSCYATGSVSGEDDVGGLVGYNFYYGSLTSCYATGSVTGAGQLVGGLVGWNYDGTITACFWDIQTSGLTTSDGGTGKTTAEMQTKSTFTAAGWDFITPIWTIREGLDYPRLWWEISNAAPVADAGEDRNTPILFELTLDGSGSYDPDKDYPLTYYWQIAEKPEGSGAELLNPESVSPSFVPDVLGEYRIELVVTDSKGLESEADYVVITAITVEEAVAQKIAETIEQIGELDPHSLRNPNLANALINKFNATLAKLDEGLYQDALDDLQKDILQKTDGCANTGQPDKNDWILTCEDQAKIYPLVVRTIELLQRLLEG